MGDFDKNKLNNICIQFRIPFPIDVLNSLKVEDAGTPYIVIIDNVPCEIKFERIYDFKYKAEGTDILFSKMDEDRSGILSHMIVQIIFDTRIIDKVNIDKETIIVQGHIFLNESVIYLNKFIQAYKHVSEQFWIRQIVKQEILIYHYILRDSEGNHAWSEVLFPQPGPLQCSNDGGFELGKKKDDILRRNIQANFFNFRNELAFNAKDNLSLGNHNVALLYSVIKFENFVYANLKNQGVSNTKIDKFKKKDCGCLDGINEVCRKGIKEWFKVDFEETDEYKNLIEYITIRNNIVHGKIDYNIDFETCSNGINAFKLAEEFLIENIFKNTI
jgi:hypothetical protein